MPMSPIENRQGKIDYVPIELFRESLFIVYRLPQQKNHLDVTYIKIVHPGFIYIHIAPVLAIVILRAGIRIGRRFRTTADFRRQFSHWNSRQFLSLLAHAFFSTAETNTGHTERLLLASWRFFCFIMWSAYSAYLVTSFVVEPPELSIKSLRELADNKDFRVGMRNSSSAAMMVFKTSHDIRINKIWERLQQQNQTDPLTFSPSLEIQAQRVIEGGYALIGGACLILNECHDYFLPNHTDIRSYAQTDIDFTYPSYIGIPTDVFYKDELFKLLLNFEQAGILDRLKYKHFKAESSQHTDTGRLREGEKPVTMARIELLLFVSLGGILHGAFCLGLEYGFCKWKIAKDGR